MSSEEDEALSAFNLLCNTPSSIICTHRELATKAIRHLTKILETSENVDTVLNAAGHGVAHSPPKSLLNPETSHLSLATNYPPQHIDTGDSPSIPYPSIPSSIKVGQDTSRKRKRGAVQKSRSVEILQRAKERLSDISAFSKQKVTLSEILHEEQETQYRDKRVDHLKQVDGNRTPNNEQKLLKGLSQISLAQQFTAWERKKGWKPKIDQLYNNLRQASVDPKYHVFGNNRSGKIAQYIRDYGYPESDHTVLTKGISRGINQLLFEKLANNSLTHPDDHAAIHGVVAMITIFEYGQFQCLKPTYLPQIIALLVGEEERVFKNAAKDISVWFEPLSSDFQLISRNPGRSMQEVRDQNKFTCSHTHSLVPAREADPYYSTHNDARSSEVPAQSFQSHDTAFPRTSAHELTSFSTIPRNVHDAVEQPANASFPTVRLDEPALMSAQNTAIHELAEFSRVPAHARHDYAGFLFPEISPHELASISTNPTRATSNSLFRSAPRSESQFDIQDALPQLPLDSNTMRLI